MVLGNLPVPGCPTYLDSSRARAYCACSRCGWDCLDIFSLVYFFFFLPILGEGPFLKGPLSPKQPTNQPSYSSSYVYFYLCVYKICVTYVVSILIFFSIYIFSFRRQAPFFNALKLKAFQRLFSL